MYRDHRFHIGYKNLNMIEDNQRSISTMYTSQYTGCRWVVQAAGQKAKRLVLQCCCINGVSLNLVEGEKKI